MPYISESKLKSFAPITTFSNEQQLQAKQTSFAAVETTVFLSHSHNDRHLIQPTVELLRRQGVRVYVDWLDEEMPTTISEETAERLKKKVEEHRKFILLATRNSKDSKWVPWELGYGDRTKTLEHIAVMPINALGGWDFEGTEYVKIYPKIIQDDAGDFIVYCNKPLMWEKLASWLRKP